MREVRHVAEEIRYTSRARGTQYDAHCRIKTEENCCLIRRVCKRAGLYSYCWWIAPAGEKLGARSDHVLIDS